MILRNSLCFVNLLTSNDLLPTEMGVLTISEYESGDDKVGCCNELLLNISRRRSAMLLHTSPVHGEREPHNEVAEDPTE